MRAVVDTSLWIDAWRGDVTGAEKQQLDGLFRQHAAILPQIVWLELQVGLRSPQEREYLLDVRSVCYWEPLTESDGLEAERLATLLRGKGVVLPVTDLLILTAARRLGAVLLHHDEDFTRALKLPDFARLRPE